MTAPVRFSPKPINPSQNAMTTLSKCRYLACILMGVDRAVGPRVFPVFGNNQPLAVLGIVGADLRQAVGITGIVGLHGDQQVAVGQADGAHGSLPLPPLVFGLLFCRGL